MKVCGYYNDWKRWDGSESYGGVGWYRIINPLSKLGHKTVGRYTIGGPEKALEMKEHGDIWLTKPADSSHFDILMGTARDFTGAKLVVDLDDEPFDINEKHPQYKALKEKSHTVQRLIEIADHIVVATEPLKDSIEKYNPNITVIPNAIDPAIWKVKKPRKNKRLKIGWIGSGSHLADMPVIIPPMKEILQKYDVEFHMAGIICDDLGDDRIFHHVGTAGYKEFPQFLAELNLDIAIAPLLDTKFNQCKSNIKWLESSMLGIPMVLSDVKPYSDSVRNYKTGYLASNTAQWVKYLSWLIESPQKRKQIGQEAKKEVLANWTIERQLPKYTSLFEKLMPKNITVYTTLSGKGDIANKDILVYKDSYTQFKDDRRNSRIQKIMPHLFFDSEYSIYLDSNIELLAKPEELLVYLKNHDIAVFKHPGRDCIYDEAEACKYLGKEDPLMLAQQVKDYAKKGVLPHSGLAECGVIVRRHTQRINDLNEKWWAHYCRYGARDQISFPVVFPKDEVYFIDKGVTNHPYFKFHAK